MIPASGLAGSLLKNAVSQIGGRLLLSLGRLGAALLIVHLLGTDRFGEYALVLNFVALFEWLCDFGQTDIAVRNICQMPVQERAELGALAWLKILHGVLFCLLLPVTLAAAGYSAPMIRAGVAGGVSLLFYAGVQVFRTNFKTRMCMERDILAELGGLVAMLPLTWWACRTGAEVDVLVGGYCVGRVVFFVLMLAFARGLARPDWHRARWDQIWTLFRQSAPLGVTGLLVSVYDTLPAVALSKLADMHAVAEYAAATRFVYPVIIVVQALSSAFYPPLAMQWRISAAGCAALQQAALNVSILIGGGLFCGIFGGSAFLMGLMGPAIGAATPVLRVMALVVLARSITTAMSPLIVVAGRQGMGLVLTGLSVLLEIGALLVLVPRYGLMGAVGGYLGLELLLGVWPVSWLGQRAAGVRMRWGIPARLVTCALAAVSIASLLPTSGSLVGGILAGVFFLLLAVATGSLSVRQVRAIFTDIASSRRAARLAGAAV